MPKPPSNILERRATMLEQEIEDRARRIAQMEDEEPPMSEPLTPEKAREMFYASPLGDQADAMFWQVHDQVLSQTGDATQAEKQALEAVYPERARLVGVGLAPLDIQVKRAEELRRLVDRAGGE
ncbi:MAG: hypothetical protein GEU71_03615 [Actinobacteria bacterium]|nr:hypothetical protein [Actinomycetota bacterium]